MDSCIEKTQVYVATAKSLSLGLPLQFIDPLLELGKMLDSAETWWEETSTQVTFFPPPQALWKTNFLTKLILHEKEDMRHTSALVFLIFLKSFEGEN